MRSLWMEMKYIKSAARVLNRDCVNKGGLYISKKLKKTIEYTLEPFNHYWNKVTLNGDEIH